MLLRGRATGALGALALLAVLANGLPVNKTTSLECSNVGAVQALQANLDSSEAFCGVYAGYVKPPGAAVITDLATTTDSVGEVTVTVTTTSTPTILMTIMDDHAPASTTLTTTVTRPTCAGIPTTTLARIAETTMAPAPTAPPTRRGEGTPAGIVHGGRDVQLPVYLTSYQPVQISSACTCLASSQAMATRTITQLMAVTAQAETVTKTYTTVNSAVVQYLHVGQAHTITATACLATGGT